MSQLYDPRRLQETITLHNGATLTRVRGGDWSVEGELPDLFPIHSDDRLDQALAASRQELATGSTYDYKLGKYIQIDPIHTSAMIALMEATLEMRKEQTHDECQADAEWQWRAGVRG